jgi:hypothetical protein
MLTAEEALARPAAIDPEHQAPAPTGDSLGADDPLIGLLAYDPVAALLE